jgi:hypothetical protein
MRILLLAMIVFAALPTAADARQRVVVDADMSFDDAAALAYLAQADRQRLVDLDAVTVSLSSVGYTGRGLSHARCLVRKHGLRGVPVSDGNLLGANPLPEAIRSYVDRVVNAAPAPCADVPTEGRAERDPSLAHDGGHRDGGDDPVGPRCAGVHAPGPHVLVGSARRGRGDHGPLRDLRAHQAQRRAERGGGGPDGHRPTRCTDPPGRQR